MSVRLRKWTDSSGKRREAWVVDVVFQHADGSRKRITKASPVNTRRGAEEYERQLRGSLLTGTFGKEPVQIPTVEEFSPTYRVYNRNNNKMSTIVSKEHVLGKHVLPFFGKMKLNEVTPGKIEDYKALKLEPELSPKTINNSLSVLRKLLDVAVDYGHLQHLPRVKWLRAPKTEIDFLNFDEAARLVDAAEDQWRPLITLALNTGLRRGELKALRWDDLDLVAGKVFVRRSVWLTDNYDTPKSGRSREVPLNDRTILALKQHRHLRGDFVFCREDGSPLTNDICQLGIRKTARSAGLRRIG